MKVMAHLVAGYPTTEIAFAAAKGLVEGNVAYLEVQFPFSDPSADGKAIQTACAEVLSRSYTLADGFAFVEELHRLYPAVPIFIMTYANLAYKTGISAFVNRAKLAGAAGLIVPDLPFDRDEGLQEACEKEGLVSIPVLAPSMRKVRIEKAASLGRPYIYAALRAGITGASTVIDESTYAFLRSVSENPAGKGKILAGFGIKTGAQAKLLEGYVHAAIAGSVFVDIIREEAPRGSAAVTEAIRKKALEISGFA